MTLELSYQAQIKPGWTVQPFFQYIVNPGGHVADPLTPNRRSKAGVARGAQHGRLLARWIHCTLPNTN